MKFTVIGDDGVRLYADGQIVPGKWIPQGSTTFTVSRELTQGTHQIVLEYFYASGRAVAKLSYESTADPDQPPPPAEPFAAEYFDDTELTGGTVLTRTDDAIDFDWGGGSPTSGVPVDRFSARWTRTRTYESGTLSIDCHRGRRNPGAGGWYPGHRRLAYQAPTTYTADVEIAAGQRAVVVEYFEHTGGAVANFGESKVQ